MYYQIYTIDLVKMYKIIFEKKANKHLAQLDKSYQVKILKLMKNLQNWDITSLDLKKLK